MSTEVNLPQRETDPFRLGNLLNDVTLREEQRRAAVRTLTRMDALDLVDMLGLEGVQG